MIQRYLALAAGLWLSAGMAAGLQAQSAQNPIANYYGPKGGYPVWTDVINWDNRINMATYANGANDFEKFENARDQLSAQGGGVLYYPAGTYNFADHPTGLQGRGLMLKSNIAIVGEAPPAGQDKAVIDSVTEGLSNLGTVFNFPFIQKPKFGGGFGEVPETWNQIGLHADANTRVSEIINIGVAWIKLNGGYINFGTDMAFNSSMAVRSGNVFRLIRTLPNPGESFSWSQRVPNGQHPIDIFGGAGNPAAPFPTEGRRFLFGCRLDNSAVLNEMTVDKRITGTFADSTTPGAFAAYRFTARVNMDGPNVFVANNCLPKSNKNFLYEQKTLKYGAPVETRTTTILFDYAKTAGIDVNKQSVNTQIGKCDYRNGPYVSENVVIKDNYVYNHGQKGYEATGKFFILKDNINQRDFLDATNTCYGIATPQTNLTLDGWAEAGPNSDNLSRAYDIGGWNSWIDHNYFDNTGSAPGNDGEGILIQPQGGMIVASWAETRNSQGNRGDDSYLAPYDVPVYGMLQFKNYLRSPGAYGVAKAEANRIEDFTVVENYSNDRVTLRVVNTPRNATNIGDFLNTCPTGLIAAPGNVRITNLPQLGVKVTWDDNANNEIGFRVDRKPAGSTDWTTIAYRPRNETGSNVADFSARDNGQTPPSCANQGAFDFNVQEWVDFLGNPGAGYQYRVIALNCEEDTANAGPVVATQFPTDAKPSLLAKAVMGLYPNPAADRLSVRMSHNTTAAEIKIYDATGRLVLSTTAPAVGEVVLPIDKLNAGLYRVVVKLADQVMTSSFVKQ